MSESKQTAVLEQQIDQWRSFLQRRQAIHSVDVAELEDHLREQIAGLNAAGLAEDEAFLVAVKRMGNLDALSREFAREHSERLWKQLVVPAGQETSSAWVSKDAWVAFGLAITAALLVKLPTLFGHDIETEQGQFFYIRNMSLFVLPLLTGYFVWKRGLMSSANTRWFVLAFMAAAMIANVYPLVPGAATTVLMVLHMPIALWLGVGVAYAGGRWGQANGRMDFIRFSGELFIYFVLIALGGMLLTMFTFMIFQTIGVDPESFVQAWLIPCGAAGAVLVAAWLVEAKQSVIENMVPVLTRLFTPLFAVMVVTFLVVLLVSGRGLDIERDMLIAFDLLLVVVLCLLLYSISARDPQQAPGIFDLIQVVLVIAALLADGVALWAIAARISELGFTPNRVAALGENVILLVNLGWSAVLYIRFMRRRGTFTAIETWQTRYLPVYALWAAMVVVLFPPLFDYI